MALTQAQADTNKVNLLNAISQKLVKMGYYKNVLQYGKEALVLADRLGYKQGKAYASQAIGYAYFNQPNYSEGIKHVYAALKIFEALDNKKEIAVSLQLMGTISSDLGDYATALNRLFKALEIRKELDEKPAMAQTYNTIGGLYSQQGKYAEAFQQHFEALKICLNPEYNGPDWGLPFTYESIGKLYEKMGDNEYSKGNIKDASNKYDSALKKHLTALLIWNKIDRIDAIADIYVSIGNIYIKLKKTATGRDYLSKALQLALNLEARDIARNAYLGLSELDNMERNYKGAYEHYQLYILYRDSIVNNEIIGKMEGYKMQYEVEKKEDQIKLLSTENKLKSTLAQKESQQKKIIYAGMGAILLAGGYGFYHILKRKKLQTKQAVLNERLRISSELHDEVGATLSGIAMYSHLTKEQLKTGQTAEIEKSLNVMQQSSAQMVDKLSDIVWLINPDQDSLEKLVERLEAYARDMAAIKNIQVSVSVPEKIEDINLPVENRRNIYLFCKEAINNAVKYSNASALELTVKQVNGLLEFTVTDNGKGFDAVMVRRGNGLENMQKRANEIGAKLLLQSKENEGASVSLQCKVS